MGVAGVIGIGEEIGMGSGSMCAAETSGEGISSPFICILTTGLQVRRSSRISPERKGIWACQSSSPGIDMERSIMRSFGVSGSVISALPSSPGGVSDGVWERVV